jgi:p-aminobenzoyl-glutamate transporter AbgT
LIVTGSLELDSGVGSTAATAAGAASTVDVSVVEAASFVPHAAMLINKAKASANTKPFLNSFIEILLFFCCLAKLNLTIPSSRSKISRQNI